MNEPALGRLERVELRTAWISESRDFTPWLAKAENLELLGEVLDIGLELEAQEKFVGPFRADILCRDVNSDNWVLIENQLEQTDHRHLGQLLTYAAGLDAVTIIWISEKFTEEHRAALDWLNAVTSEKINFFGLEIELWRIGSSLMAPKFNIVSKPNDWTKTVSEGARQLEAGEYSAIRQLQLAYWTGFKNFLQQHNSHIKMGTPRAQNWLEFSLGRTGFALQAFINTRDKRIGVDLVLYGSHAKAHFHLLEAEKQVIEGKLGTNLDWAENPRKVLSYLYLHKRDIDPTVKEQWPEQYKWLYEKLEAFQKVLRPKILSLDASRFQIEELTTPEGEDELALEEETEQA
ncbi:MAG TPA: DUF4268 domain-containing protein [Ktedonobacteraceae bacterium]|nr:DUF4268 domain-containing protein [Ktedonobacteraceae bacterium]